MNNFLFLIDSGHGGMINGIYQTAPRKMYKFPNGEIAYEGVLNRIFKEKLFIRLNSKGIKYVDVCPTEEDIPLLDRTRTVNRYARQYGKENCLLISLHSNAGKGTGFEIWTSRGKTQSDEYADILGKILIRKFSYIKFRADKTDGDLDKEANFFILRHTICPAILPECLFFDNYSDYLMLKDPLFQDRYVSALMEFIQKVKKRHENKVRI